MNRTRWAVAVMATALGLFLFLGGTIVIVNGTPYQATYTSWTGTWGMLPGLFGLVILGVVAFVVWDESR